MFKNRKKSSAKRPADDSRERDNSRVLGSYTDTDPAPPTPVPFRRESLTPGNFQYLKLTDGFNIVLSSDTGDSESAFLSQQKLTSSSPERSHLPLSQRSASENDKRNTKETGEDETKGGLVAYMVTALETEQNRSLQRKKKNVHSERITSSITNTTSPRSLPHSPPGESLELSSGLPATSKTPGSEERGLPAKSCSEAGHTDLSKEDPSVLFDVGHAATSGVPGCGPEGKQKDSSVDSAGGLTGKTQELEGRRNETAKTMESADKQQSLKSGRGASSKTSPSPVLTLLAGAPHADRAKPSLPSSDDTTARESEPASIPTTEAVDDDKEPNKATEQTGAFISTTAPGEDRSVFKLHSADRKYHERKQKLDTPEVRHRYSTLRQSNDDADTAHTGHASNAADPESGRSKAADFRENLIGFGRKKTSVKITDDVTSDAGKRRTVSDMFRLNRHTLTTKPDPGEKPAVYRKLEDPKLGHREGSADIQTPSSDSAAHTPERAPEPSVPTSEQTPPEKNPPLAPRPLPPTTYPLTPRSERPTPLPKPRKNPAVERVYENWTINQAVTQVVDTTSLDDDDDDADEVDSDAISGASSTLDRHSAQGSKDSGLCVDVQSVTTLTPETETGHLGDGGGSGGGGDNASAATSTEEGGVDVDRSQHGDGETGGRERKDTVDASFDALRQAELPIYQNTAVLPRPDEDVGDLSSAGTPEGPDSPADARRLTANMAPGTRHHGDHSLASTASENNKPDLSTSGDSSFDEENKEEAKLQSSASSLENTQKMRQLLVKGVLETEKTYLAILELLLHYKRTLEASCRTSQPVISEEDITLIFCNLQELRDIHKVFVEGLQSQVDAWAPEQTVGDVFLCLVEEFPEFGSYAENYQTAVATIHRCSQDNHRFQELAQQIVLTSTTREVTSLEDALFKPVQRLQRNTLVLYDLIKHTPKGHPDQETLQNALQLSQKNLENFGTSLVPKGKVEQKAELVKGSFLVELVGTSRKLRYIFVFSEMLVCTKREQEDRGEVTFDCKWFIPINELQLDTKFTYQDDSKFFKRDEIEDVKKKLRSVKTEMKKELKKEDKQRPVSSLVPSRTVEKLQRKATELEGQLIMSSPRLPFKVWHDAGKAYTFLMTTDYEREEWRELLSSLQRQSTNNTDTTATPSTFDVQEMVNSVRGLPEINEIGSVLIETEEEMIYGTLNVTVHKLTGLTEPCDTYCCLEMDSYGHFFMKARTHISARTCEPSWNSDFELDLEGSQTLRVLCYRKGPGKEGDLLLCRGALEMTKAWLKGTFEEKIITMNEYSLVLSICYTVTEKTLRRTPVRQSGTAVFGVPISTCATREGKTVPTIVTACVREVENRGMKEMGIYRVSGVTSDVQRLKKHFDKSVKVGVSSLSDVDIHTVTSLLKLYLRELPDPVFTEANYPNFLDALKLNDKEGKEKCMLSLFYHLPDINYYTAVYMLEHLLRISHYESENKMSVHNLSTIFGPTLLAPAPEKLSVNVMELMTQGAEHCMKQSQVVHFYLTLMTRGASLRRSSAVIT